MNIYQATNKREVTPTIISHKTLNSLGFTKKKSSKQRYHYRTKQTPLVLTVNQCIQDCWRH